MKVNAFEWLNIPGGAITVLLALSLAAALSSFGPVADFGPVRSLDLRDLPRFKRALLFIPLLLWIGMLIPLWAPRTSATPQPSPSETNFGAGQVVVMEQQQPIPPVEASPGGEAPPAAPTQAPPVVIPPRAAGSVRWDGTAPASWIERFEEVAQQASLSGDVSFSAVVEGDLVALGDGLFTHYGGHVHIERDGVSCYRVPGISIGSEGTIGNPKAAVEAAVRARVQSALSSRPDLAAAAADNCL